MPDTNPLPLNVELPPPTSPAGGNFRSTPRWNLFLTGFVVLFLELACIRWFAAYVVFLQFFTNIVLIACFVGMSIGCLCAEHKTDWLRRFPYLCFLAVAVAILVNALYTYWSGVAIDVGGQASPQVVFFGTETRHVDLAKFVVPIEVLAGLFFVLITLTFIGPGQVLGRCFNAYPDRVVAYTLNILGSLAGICAFALISFTGLPPAAWFVLGFAGVAYFLWQAGLLDRGRVLALAGSIAVVVAAGTPLDSDTQVLWSPYYKIQHAISQRAIAVNQISHQTMYSWDQPTSWYSAPHLLQRDTGGQPFEDVLIIGAGSGNDVAHTLHHGARHIDAVEIDPVILDIGKRFHPDRPYDDARVHTHLDDGRNFLRSTQRKYDLVTYALVDSLMLHSSYSSIRLESFLFTEQALRDVKNVLKPDGVFVMYNYFRQGWIIERITDMLEEQFGQAPLVFSFPRVETIAPQDSLDGSITMILAGDTDRIAAAFEEKGTYWLNQSPALALARNGFDGALVDGADDPTQWHQIAPAQVVSSTLEASVPATDDWPFLYLREPSVPWLYVRGMALIGGLALIMLFLASPRGTLGFNGRMFFLGAGFLLLETKAVVHMALVFGSTWLVNSLVFFSILVMILAANLYVLKRPSVRVHRHYLGLFLCLALNCIVPLNIFLAGNLIWKYVAPCILVLLPMFFAGVVFAVSFRQSRHPNRDFGANIAGAVVGGLAEYTSMLLGFRYLLFVAIGLYALSAVFGRRASKGTGRRQVGPSSRATQVLESIGA